MKQAVRWPSVAGKTRLIYNGVEIIDFFTREEARDELAKILGQSRDIWSGVTVIGSIGELTKNKGYEYAIPAIQHIPNCIYIIIGTGYDKQQLEIMSLTKDTGEKIFFTGFVADASRYMKAFDIFLLPSLKEGVPYVLLEAGLANLPVISSSVGGIPEIIQGNVNGILINSKSIVDMEETLTTLIHNPELQRSFGTNLEQTVKTKFSLEAMIEKTSKMY